MSAASLWNLAGAVTASGKVGKIGVNAPLAGWSLGGPPSYEPDEAPSIIQAFNRRLYLVVMHFVQRKLVASVKTLEFEDSTKESYTVTTPEAACELALRRAMTAFKEAGTPLGNLLYTETFRDTPDIRKQLGVGGPVRRITYNELWKDAT